MFNRYILLILALVCYLSGNAQLSTSKLFFDHLTTEEGLAHNYILSIFQDEDGFVWLGSDNGLNRYDGQHIDILSSNTKPALGGNRIRRIIQDKSKTLWILHENGLDMMDHYTQHIRSFLYGRELKKHILGFGLDDNGDLAAFTESDILLYNSNSGSFDIKQTAPANFLFSAFVKCGNRYYLGTRRHGIIVYNENWKLLEHIYPTSIQGGILEDGLISLLRVDSNGSIWSVMAGLCIQKYDPVTRIVQTYPLSAHSVINREVRDIIELNADYMLVGTFNGLYRLHKRTFQAIVEEGELGEKGALNHYSIYSLYKDSQGIIWVGTYAGGVNYSHSYNQRFQYFAPPHFSGRISMAREDGKGNIWFGTEGNGLLCHNAGTDKIVQYWLEGKGRHYSDNIIKSICIAGDTIMCGNWRGEVYLYSIKKNSFTLYKAYERNNVLYIYRDSRQNWWVSIQDYGVVCIGDDSIKFPSSNFIQEIRPGILVFATQKEGLYIYDLKRGQVRSVGSEELGMSKDQSISVTSFYQDTDRNLWLTTENSGVLVLDGNWKLKQRFLEPERGYSDKLYFVAEQKKGKYWIVGAHKLYLLDYAKNQIHPFDKNNGLQLTDMDASACIDSRNYFWLPGNTGYVKVDNSTFALNEEPSSVIFTGLRINNKLQMPNEENSVLKKCLSETEVVRLRHNQTNISVTYASDNHIYANSNCFFYKMEGVDPDWVDAGNRREVFYSNLAPGNYTLKVKALNNDGAMGLEARLKIEVLPPLWARWWAFIIYAVILFYILQRYVAYKQRKQRLEHELYLKQIEKDKSEELNKELQTFFTQVAHEFRTPLTLILNPLDEIQNRIIHISGVKDEILLIRRNAKRLLALVNDLMDLRKIENGNGKLELSSSDFNDFIQEVYYSFQTMARQRSITLQLSLPKKPILATFDREGLEKVFFNLLSNALKFTPEEGTVSLVVTITEGESPQIHIEVRDTGEGISDEDISKVFKPFALSHQDLHGQMGGSGVELAIARAIVEKHGGVISVSRVEPHGTSFSIDLPWNYDKRYEVTSPISIEDNEEILNETPFKVASISDTVLLVDDNIEILAYLQKELSRGFRILTAQNGREALEVLGKENVSLVVSDVMMPEMDGMELCMHIKDNPSFCHLPVVLLTAKSMTMHVEEGFQAGADDYLVKPFKISTLIIRINNILAGRKKLKEIYGKQLSLKSVGIELEPADKSFVDQYESIVKKHLSNPDFDVEMLCKEMGVSRAKLYRKVKAITNLSPAEVIRNIRLECAAEMLRTSGQTATEIAYLTGFGSYNHFSDYFKSIYGVSPKNYKDKYRNT